MSKAEEKLKKLENKIDNLTKLVEALHKSLLATFGDLAETLDKSRKKDEEHERRLERKTYYRGLIMGLLLGIMGNFMVSYLMKCLEGYNISGWGWGLGYTTSLLFVLLLVWLLDRESKKYSEKRL